MARIVATEEADARTRILAAAAELVRTGGIAALTTRGVAAAAGVQAPAIYRLFGDKRGLLDAVAEDGLGAFVRRKAGAERHPDPIHDLEDAWRAYIAFGTEHPAVFAIMTELSRTASPSAAAMAGIAILRERVARIAHAGWLRVPQPLAVALIHAAGTGTIATLLASPEERRDPRLADLALKAVLSAIVGANAGTGVLGTAELAIALRAHLSEINVLSPGERLLMAELLDRATGG